MVVDLNLNENEIGYLGDSIARAPRLKVRFIIVDFEDLDNLYTYLRKERQADRERESRREKERQRERELKEELRDRERLEVFLF